MSSTGTDAATDFRVFNPVLEGRQFDPDGRFVARECPALARLPPAMIRAPFEASPQDVEAAGVRLRRANPSPCVDHAKVRLEIMARFEALRERRPGAKGN